MKSKKKGGDGAVISMYVHVHTANNLIIFDLYPSFSLIHRERGSNFNHVVIDYLISVWTTEPKSPPLSCHTPLRDTYVLYVHTCDMYISYVGIIYTEYTYMYPIQLGLLFCMICFLKKNTTPHTYFKNKNKKQLQKKEAINLAQIY